ncbi:hypothetical protein F8M41_018876 [Gigaspora margarita]|uniref:Uncharacterized protein n=1 Tax=Gigaspora margarita TaxID=4874 RepID=A0A8H4EKY7_GIGMA|nr:hypothetical protein F8M41_018876 [Gigaspora margarita]
MAFVVIALPVTVEIIAKIAAVVAVATTAPKVVKTVTEVTVDAAQLVIKNKPFKQLEVQEAKKGSKEETNKERRRREQKDDDAKKKETTGKKLGQLPVNAPGWKKNRNRLGTGMVKRKKF